MTEEQKARIDAMSQIDLCRLWRFAASGHSLMQGEAGEHLKKSLAEKGGFTPAISKALGWSGREITE